MLSDALSCNGSGLGRDLVGTGSGTGRDWVGTGRDWVGTESGLGGDLVGTGTGSGPGTTYRYANDTAYHNL